MDKNTIKNEEKYWVALSTHQKIGARTLAKLWKRFKKLEKVWQASRQDIVTTGLDLGQIEAVQEVIAKVDPDKEIGKLSKYNIEVVLLPDENYPKVIKEIPDPPGLLYIRGKILPQDEIALGVVGSRKFSLYGERVTEQIVYSLAKNKLTIISGLALGIDAKAHEAALDAKGRTIAVLGCGLDQIYPSSNTRIADKILQSGGAIISEFPLGMPAMRYNFPIRNRIIAGLSLGTLVIEGGLDSGSLITATAALDYNREVFAVPGEIFSETAQGPNKLIQMGAKLVTSAQDILEELQIKNLIQEKEAQEIIPDSKEEEILLNLLKTPVQLDIIVGKSGLSVTQVNSTITMLEMKGKVQNMGGTIYKIKGKLGKYEK